MQKQFSIGRNKISLHFPEDTVFYESRFPEKNESSGKLFESALFAPMNSPGIKQIIARRKPGHVVIVVSDITRPVPYREFMSILIKILLDNGIRDREIIFLVATGMHRASTRKEKEMILGDEIVSRFNIIDHNAEDTSNLKTLPLRSYSGKKISVNKIYADAGLKIITGLVEPHFMAGFSGGRKTICPGLSALESIANFHGYNFLSDENARNGHIAKNPCHLESLSVAQKVGCDLNINVVLNGKKEIIRFFTGELMTSHEKAVQFVSDHACIEVKEEADLTVTSSGGAPLDDTFYQCVKGFVSVLPAVKRDARIISLGGCHEGTGSDSYSNIMYKYANNYKQFIYDIRATDKVLKDQWQFQMHCKTLDKIGKQNLLFYTTNLAQPFLDNLNVNGKHLVLEKIEKEVQEIIYEAERQNLKIAAFPHGPYAVPVI